MKIALVTELYEPSIGGQQTRFKCLADELRQRDHEVEVLCARHDSALPTNEIIDGVTIRRAPTGDRYLRPLVPYLQRSLLETARFAYWVRQQLRGDFDVVYFNQWPLAHVLFAPRSARERAGIDWCELRHGLVHSLAQAHLPRRVRFNFCVNPRFAKELEVASGMSVGYLPTGIDIDRYAHADSSARAGVIFVGRLVPNKNLSLLISGFGEFVSRGWREPLVIAGDGPSRPELLGAIAHQPQRVQELISYVGSVSEQDKVELMARSRVMALSSTREGSPNVIAEAMASGLPIATVNAMENGAAEIVKLNGIGVVGTASSDGLADALELVMRGWPELSARCLAARDDIAWGRIVDKLLLTMSNVATVQANEQVDGRVDRVPA
jgi:glycosyltransferase involved in cell wall biosynthesis